jgi:hypothetical protein
MGLMNGKLSDKLSGQKTGQANIFSIYRLSLNITVCVINLDSMYISCILFYN